VGGRARCVSHKQGNTLREQSRYGHVDKALLRKQSLHAQSTAATHFRMITSASEVDSAVDDRSTVPALWNSAEFCRQE
jgi:hypothetical protein